MRLFGITAIKQRFFTLLLLFITFVTVALMAWEEGSCIPRLLLTKQDQGSEIKRTILDRGKSESRTSVSTAAASRTTSSNPHPPPSPPQTQTVPKGERFIIYVCDKTRYCYGLGDRERAVAGLYLLSTLTNRTFGMIWTQLSPLTKFLEPNEVDWDIPTWKLKEKTSIELEFLKPSNSLNFGIPFNKQYPYDVVYIRTNHNYIYGIKNSKYLAPKLPQWTRPRVSTLTGRIMKKLWKPTDLTRKHLNDMLIKIVQAQRLDDNIVDNMVASKTCRDACEYLKNHNTNWILHAQSTALNESHTITGNERVDVLKKKEVLDCMSEIRKNHTSLFQRGKYETSPGNSELVSVANLNMFCKSGRFNKSGEEIPRNKASINIIRKAKGYDVVNLNLLCVHVRIGRSAGMPFDPARNSMESTKVLWDFVRSYIERGHHLYIATDYDQVRHDSKALFGLRAHSSDTPIVHIATVQKHQNETEGMELAIWEQLLLMTSCKTLVQSHSGFSSLAAAVRESLVSSQEKFMFEKGKIRRVY